MLRKRLCTFSGMKAIHKIRELRRASFQMLSSSDKSNTIKRISLGTGLHLAHTDTDSVDAKAKEFDV